MATIRERRWTGADGIERRAWLCAFKAQSGRRRYKQFPTKKAADAWLLKARGEVAAGIYSPDSTSITVGQAAELWLQHSEQAGLEPATIARLSLASALHRAAAGRDEAKPIEPPADRGVRRSAAGHGLLAGTGQESPRVGQGDSLGKSQRRGLASWNPAQPVSVKIDQPTSATHRDSDATGNPRPTGAGARDASACCWC